MGTSNRCPSDDRRVRRWLWGIAALAVILRLAGLAFVPTGSLDEDAFEYGMIARHILDGDGYSFDLYGSSPLAPSAWMPPFYTYLLAGYAWLFGPNLLGLGIIQALVGGLTCWLLGRIGWLASGPNVGLIAAGLFAPYPEAVFMPGKFVAEPWLLMFELLFLLCGLFYLRQERRQWMILAGILAGLSALTKESALLYPLFFLVWIWLKKPVSRKLAADSLLLLMITACTIAPWTIRNYTVFERFVLVRTPVWFNVWRGNHPGATGTARSWDQDLIENSLDPQYAQRLDSQLIGGEIGYEETYRRFALEYIRENPVEFIALTLRRLWYFWTVDPTHPLATHPLYWAPWFALLGLVGMGMVTTRNRWRDYSFWYLLIVATTVAYSLTMVLPRYRLPLLPGLVLLAGEGGAAIWAWWGDRKARRQGIIR